MNFSEHLLIPLVSILSASAVHGEDAEQFVARLITDQTDAGRIETKDSPLILKEIHSLFAKDNALGGRVEKEEIRLITTAHIMWTAARLSNFNDSSFRQSFPALAAYGNVLLVSQDYFNTPRIIYMTAVDRSSHDVHMLYGNGKMPDEADFVQIDNWDDREGLADWLGDYSFEKADNGPYLVSTSIGRQTTGATSVRHVLGWVRIEATRLVWERFEGYDVPVGQERQKKHLKVTARPQSPPSRAPNGPSNPTGPTESKQY